jgi:CARDB
MLMTTDGLSYTELSSPLVDAQTEAPVSSWFPTVANPMNDWIQPIRSAPATPAGPRQALTVSANVDGVYLLDPADRHWHAWTLPGGATPPTYVQIDSAGRIHNVRSAGAGRMQYRISADGGRTWTTATFPLPFASDDTLLNDFKVNRAVGIAAVALRLHSQDWVYKFDIRGSTARLLRRYRVGLGDNPAGSDVGALTSPRMDFQNVVIFPDGRIATSFLDSTTLSHPPGTGQLGRITPALAIELDTTLPPLEPDLAAGVVTLGATKTDAGDSVTFTAGVANLGPGNAKNVVVRFYADGSTATASSDVWSAVHRDGQHTVKVVVDPANAIAETNETNNAATKTFQVEGGRLVT